MAQKLYSSIGGLSNEVTKMYGSISGLSDNIIKGYCSVNGLSKLFFNGNGKPDKSFWFYYTTINGKIIEYRAIGGFLPPLTNNVVTKTNTGIAFYCTTRDINGSCIITFSTDSNAVAYVDTIQGYSTNPTTGNVIINDETWYYAYEDLRPNATAMDVSPECTIDEPTFSSMTPVQIITWIINNRIYTNDFAEEYQEGQRYNLPVGDMEKTIRKYLAVYLYKNYEAKTGSSAVPYANVLEHVEDIVNYFMQYASGRIIELCADTPEGDSWGIRFIAYYGDANLDNILVENRTDGYEGYSNCSLDLEVTYSSYAQIDFKTDGTITYKNQATSGSDYGYIGIGGYGIDYLNWSNIGLKFSPSSHHFTNNWSPKTWNGFNQIDGSYIWTDGDNIYYSDRIDQYVLNKITSTWTAKTWNIGISGAGIWTDGTNIYHSSANGQYVLNKSTGTWVAKTWNGYTPTYGIYVWTDGSNIYYSNINRNAQYILDKSTDTWNTKTWNYNITWGNYVWTDGNNIYYSYPYGNSDAQYVLNKSNNTWQPITWNISSIDGRSIWTDGDNIYYSYQYVLDKT